MSFLFALGGGNRNMLGDTVVRTRMWIAGLRFHMDCEQ